MIVLYVKILAYMSIKKIIAFGSAKGGVGKSSITAAVALSMAKKHSIGILDADIYGPNQHLLFNIKEKLDLHNSQIEPINKKNIKIVSMGNIISPNEAAIWRGPMLSSSIKKIIQSTNWGNLDYLLIDMPPGTGDAYLTIFEQFNIDQFILVTLNNMLANADACKTISMLKKLKINILGYVLNNIFPVDYIDSKITKINDIEHISSFNFEENIYNFDLNIDRPIANELSEYIYKNV